MENERKEATKFSGVAEEDIVDYSVRGCFYLLSLYDRFDKVRVCSIMAW